VNILSRGAVMGGRGLTELVLALAMLQLLVSAWNSEHAEVPTKHHDTVKLLCDTVRLVYCTMHCP
jgi:hypothetical protein